jgi:multisubunit Na+/H+ antiporter MnhB subunit
MANVEFGLTAALVIMAALSSALPVAAWSRTREPRFLLVAGAGLLFMALGLAWAYGLAAAHPPAWSSTTEASVGIVDLAVGCLLVSTLLPRRRP